MGAFTLTELQYSEDRKGPWKLYIYRKDADYQRDGSGAYEYVSWFGSPPDDEKISIVDAFSAAMEASVVYHKEVRVCDGGDMLVYHSKDDKTLYGQTFWGDVLGTSKK